MVAVLIYAADAAARRRLVEAVGRASEPRIVGTVGDIAALRRAEATEQFDAVLVDIPQGGRIDELVAALRVPIVALVENGDEGVLDALYAGVHAALPREAGADEIRAALLAAASGLATLPASLLAPLLSPRSGAANLTGDEAGEDVLTPREIEVLAALADGASNKAIARRFGISLHTVKFHVASILAKLDAESRTEAVAKAARMGLVVI
jgi:DNA-binding NarL/FixJ family response regulator